jgi:hypothetical protein
MGRGLPYLSSSHPTFFFFLPTLIYFLPTPPPLAKPLAATTSNKQRIRFALPYPPRSMAGMWRWALLCPLGIDEYLYWYQM